MRCMLALIIIHDIQLDARVRSKVKMWSRHNVIVVLHTIASNRHCSRGVVLAFMSDDISEYLYIWETVHFFKYSKLGCQCNTFIRIVLLQIRGQKYST